MKRIATQVALLVIVVVVLSVGSSQRGVVAAQERAGSGAAVAAGQPILEISKSCPDLRYVGRDATFEITVANRGGGSANNVVVTDAIQGSIDFVSADNGGVREGGNIVWRLGVLEAGATRTLKANFGCNRIGMVRNTATVTYCAAASDTCELEIKGIPAILLECVDDPDPIEINGNVTYTITVVNQGSAVGTNIVIACTLAPEQEHVSSTGPTNATAAGKDVTFAPLASLAPKASAVYKVTAKGVGEGDVRFRVELMSDQIKTPVMETESTHIY
ncbi:MAG TPA: hypothetical protein VM243_08145 [Phycisphaerae bacterium]|nr:hypothetical protein [Phycisphaerae bacterium]